MAKHSPGLPELREALVAHADDELTALELQPDGERDVERLRRAGHEGSACPGGSESCPGHDGDPCNYEDHGNTPAMPIPDHVPLDDRVVRAVRVIASLPDTNHRPRP